MRVLREASSPSAAARTATGFPEPTSPVSTPRPRAEMSQRSRATASLCAAEPNRAGTGMAAVKGMTAEPQCDCKVSIIGFSVVSAAVGGGDRGGDQADVAAVQAAQDLAQADGDVLVAEAGGYPQDRLLRSGAGQQPGIEGVDGGTPADDGGWRAGADAGP